MRTLGTIPHPDCLITVFSYNGRTLLRLEAGPMEQTYRLPGEEYPNIEAVQRIVDDGFVRESLAHFNAMYRSYLDAKGRVAK
jgi:hypothetical protein